MSEFAIALSIGAIVISCITIVFELWWRGYQNQEHVLIQQNRAFKPYMIRFDGHSFKKTQDRDCCECLDSIAFIFDHIYELTANTPGQPPEARTSPNSESD